jgi:hypothetical protein
MYGLIAAKLNDDINPAEEDENESENDATPTPVLFVFTKNSGLSLRRVFRHDDVLVQFCFHAIY